MHHTLTLAHPFQQQGTLDVAGFVPEPREDRADEFKGRGALTLDAGEFSLHLRPTPAELRALAALCQALAHDVELANVPPYTGERLRWPAGLTHLPAAPAAAEQAAA